MRGDKIKEHVIDWYRQTWGEHARVIAMQNISSTQCVVWAQAHQMDMLWFINIDIDGRRPLEDEMVVREQCKVCFPAHPIDCIPLLVIEVRPLVMMPDHHKLKITVRSYRG